MGYNVKGSNKAILFAMFLPQIISIVFITILSAFYSDLKELQNSLVYMFSMMLVAQIAFAIIIGFFACKNKINVWKSIKTENKKLTIKNVAVCVVISIVAVFGLFYFVSLFNKLFGLIGFVPSTAGLPNNTFGWFLVNVLISATLPAVLEELVFRGIVFGGLKKHGFWFACLISSFAFMFVHLSLGSVVYPIIMGIVFCLINKKTGSILYSMIVHFCNNFIVLLVEYLSNVLGKSILPDINLWWQYLLAILVAVVAIVVIWCIIKKWLTNKNSDNNLLQDKVICENQTEIEAQTQIVVNKYEKKSVLYTMIVSFVFWIIMIAISLAG